MIIVSGMSRAQLVGGERTLGGIRVERPRFWMKLILTAVWGPISINCCLCACFWVPGDVPGLQDDGGEMGVDNEVVQEAASFCQRRQATRDPSSITDIEHLTTGQQQPLQHHARHVCPTQVNCTQGARPHPAAFCCARSGAPIPRILHRRTQEDQPRGCARRQPLEQLDPDPRGKCRRGNEAPAGLQCRDRLPDIVWCTRMLGMGS